MSTDDKRDPFCNCGNIATHTYKMHSHEHHPVPVCWDCIQRMEQEAGEVNDHEMRNFGGAYGLVSWTLTPLATDSFDPVEMAMRNTKLAAELADVREAWIAARHVVFAARAVCAAWPADMEFGKPGTSIGKLRDIVTAYDQRNHVPAQPHDDAAGREK